MKLTQLGQRELEKKNGFETLFNILRNKSTTAESYRLFSGEYVDLDYARIHLRLAQIITENKDAILTSQESKELVLDDLYRMLSFLHEMISQCKNHAEDVAELKDHFEKELDREKRNRFLKGDS